MSSKYIAGYSDKNIAIVDGAVIFDLVDSKGFPLDIINDLLEENNLGFDVVGFIRKANQSKNYSNPDRLRILLVSAMKRNNPEIEKRIDYWIENIYTNTNGLVV